MATDLTITLEDRPGQLARIGQVLGDAGVNIDGVAGIVVGGAGVIHLAVEDAAGARSALEDAGFTVEDQRDALMFDIAEGQDRPGQLGRMAGAVAEAGVNVIALYLATRSRAVAVTSDNDAARRALEELSSSS
jgi:hypothetical protein